MTDINSEGHNYHPASQNCNTAADTALDRAGLPEPKLDDQYWSPGSERISKPNDIEAPSNSWLNDLYDFMSKQDWLPDFFKDWFDDLNRDGNYYTYDPLVLDLDGDGVELIAENNWNGVLFDFNGNGIKTATQWVSSDDGLLVWDRNGNGKIDDGSELFGEDTIKRPTVDTLGGASKPQEKDDGFDALRTVDSNLDGKINAKDSEWQNLRVWRDLNSDGEVQDGELFTLDELGITELDLATGLKNGSSTYLKEDGTNGKLAANDEFFTKPSYFQAA